MRIFRFLGITLTTISIAFAQAPPSTDIWLAPLTVSDAGVRLGAPVNITHRAGYDNQPSFLPDGSGVLYTSLQTEPPGPQAPTQTDIYLYNIVGTVSLRLTRTPESEYSATVMPSGVAFSVVRVEPDSTQRLWQFDLNGQQTAVILRDVKPVGYHAWVNNNTVALFVLGSPPTLQLAKISIGKSDTLAAGIGRSIHKIPGKQAISFVHKISQTEWWIKEFDVATRNITPIVQTIAGREDYAWTPDGTLVMANESKFYTFKPDRGTQWSEVADFSGQGIKGITRIAISSKGDRLAFVAAE
ncbi:MAG TPA: hypothetical protein VII11_04055 [Bacteroidota bacterium]